MTRSRAMPPSPSRRGALAAALLFAGLVGAAPSHANGRFPSAQFVTLGPGTSGDFIALRTTFGLVVSADAGRSWHWLCEDIFDYANLAAWDPRIAWGSQGVDGIPLLVGIPSGLMRTLDRCDAQRVPEMRMEFTGDVTTSADGQRVFWVASNGTGRNRIAVSDDGGRTFAFHGSGPEGLLFETIEATGPGARRVYLTGVTTDANRRVLFYRSDDGGQTLDEFPMDLHGGYDAWLSGVDPNNPDVVYVRSNLPKVNGASGGTLLLRSTDGGRRFTEVTRTRGPMMGFALSGDGRTVWVGGPDMDDRLLRSDDGGRSFQRISNVEVQCLRWHAGALYVCANNYAQGYALGRSTDSGRTITPVARFADIQGPPACPPSAVGQVFCRQRWPSVRDQINPETSMPPSMDGGVTTPPGPAPQGDCGCHAARSHSQWAWLWCFALVGVRKRRVAHANPRAVCKGLGG